MNEAILSWIAGFWEGEGNAGLYRHGKRPSGQQRIRLTVEIGQKNPTPLYRIRGVFGYGTVQKKSNVYSFRVLDRKAKCFLIAIYPYLKFRQYEIASLIKKLPSTLRERIK